MDPIIAANFAACGEVVQQSMQLLLYSHIPTAAVALLMGGFVFWHGRKDLPNRILFLISIAFALWVASSLTVWLLFDNTAATLFAWSFFGFLSMAIFVLSYYLFSVFTKQKDISVAEKIVALLLLVPSLILAPSRLVMQGYDGSECIALENINFSYYYYGSGLLIFLLILFSAIRQLWYTRGERRMLLVYFTIGIELFLLMFFGAGFVASYLVEFGYTGDFQFEKYGLFGIAFFIGLLSFLVVRYKAFDIKLIGAQALVVSTIVLIGSQFLFVRNPVNQVLTGVTFVLVTIFGYYLIRGVKREIKQREDLEELTKQLQKATAKLEVTNKKLAGANKELERLDQSKSEFLSIASHQLRTPLTVIKGYISMVQEGNFGKVPAKLAEVLGKVYISNERLISLVESLLNISRIEAGRIQFDIQPVDIVATTEAIVADFQQKAQAKSLKLEFTPDTNIPRVAADPQKIKDIISNLIDNSIKYTPSGEVNISIHQESQSVVFDCRDTGLGIDPEDLPRLFNKFVRGKGMQQVHTEGTGLGLYFARMVTENMGGRIWVESEGKGKGSKFSFSLPMFDKAKATKVK